MNKSIEYWLNCWPSTNRKRWYQSFSFPPAFLCCILTNLSFLSSSLSTWVFCRLHYQLQFSVVFIAYLSFCRLHCQLEFSIVFTANLSFLSSSLPTWVSVVFTAYLSFCRLHCQLEFSVVFTAYCTSLAVLDMRAENSLNPTWMSEISHILLIGHFNKF